MVGEEDGYSLAEQVEEMVEVRNGGNKRMGGCFEFESENKQNGNDCQGIWRWG